MRCAPISARRAPKPARVRLHERVDVIVEAGLRGIAAGAGEWDGGTWDSPSSTWSGIEPTFVALDGWSILGVRTTRGRDRGNRRNSTGTAEIRLGWASPGGKWSFRPTAPISIGMEMRISCQPRALADGTPLGDPIPIYRGSVRDISDGWEANRADPARQTFRVTCQLTDRFADLAAVDLPEQALDGLADTTDERIARVLALANISDYYLRAPHAGVVTHQSSNFARNLLDEAQVAVEGEVGDLAVDREGFFSFRERLTSGTHPREDAVQLTWANDGRAGAIGPREFGTGTNLDDVVNRVTYAKAGGTAYQAPAAIDEPTDSQSAYGLRTFQRFDLTVQDDADVEFAADYWLSQLEGRTQRIDRLSVDVNPYMPDAELVAILDVDLRDKHFVGWTDGVDTLEGSLHVQGVTHQITGTKWTIGVQLWAYADEGLEPVEAAVALWGTAVWNVDVWGI